MDDRRAGLVLRALRRRRVWRQVDLARAANVSQSVVSRAERGHLGSTSVDIVRRLFRAVDARVEFDVRWRGGELDRLVDSRHALIAGEVARIVAADGWSVQQEVTFSEFGERGAIDVVALREHARCAIAFEVKTELSSWEATQRAFDAKIRLLPTIVAKRFGWRPRLVSAVLVLEETMTNRRRLAMVAKSADMAFPARAREIRRWLSHLGGLCEASGSYQLCLRGVVAELLPVPIASERRRDRALQRERPHVRLRRAP